MTTTSMILTAAAGAAAVVVPSALLLRRSYLQLADRDRSLALARHAAAHDPLTGIANRAGLLDDLAVRAASGDQYGIAVIDLDGFKSINDTHGHEAGDCVLLAVAKRLANLAADAGGVAARLGGDEFVLVVPSPSSRASMAYGAAAHAAIVTPVQVDGLTLEVRASVGVVHALPGDPADQLLHAADLAMYRAKVHAAGIAAHDIALTLPRVPAARPIVRPRTSADATRFLAEVSR